MESKQYKHKTIRFMWVEDSVKHIKIFADNQRGLTKTNVWHLSNNPLFDLQVFIVTLLQRGITELYIYDSFNSLRQHIDVDIFSYTVGGEVR